MRISCFFVAILLAGCASPPLPVASTSESRAAGLKVVAVGSGSGAGFVRHARQAPVAVSFQGSPQLTLALRQRLEALGVRVDDAGSGRLVADAGYSFVRPMQRRSYVDVGQLFERSSGPGSSAASMREAQRGQDVLSHAYMAVAAKQLLTQTVYYESLLDSLGALTGAKGAFNRALVGDSRGLCLTNCDRWNLYEQELRVGMKLTWPGGEETVMASAAVKDEKLHPERLFEEAMTEALLRLFGLGGRS